MFFWRCTRRTRSDIARSAKPPIELQKARRVVDAQVCPKLLELSKRDGNRAVEYFSQRIACEDYRTVGNFTCVIDSLARFGRATDATHWYHSMRRYHVAPTEETFGALIHAHAKARDPAGALRVLNMLIAEGFTPSRITVGALANAYAEVGDFASAQNVLREHDVEMDAVNYGCLLKAALRSARTAGDSANGADAARKCEDILVDMQRDLGDVDTVTVNTCITANARANAWDRVWHWVDYLERGGRSDIATYTPLIAHPDLSFADSVNVLRRVLDQNVRPNVVLMSALLGKATTAEEARGVWDAMVNTYHLVPNAITIRNYTRACGAPPPRADKDCEQRSVSRLLAETTASPRKYDRFAGERSTSSSSTRSSSSSSARSSIKNMGSSSSSSSKSSWKLNLEALNQCAENGDVEGAMVLFKKMEMETVRGKERVVHNTCLKAFANAGDVDGAELFVRTRMQNIELTQKAYGKMIEACAKAHLPGRAEYWFELMRAKGIAPSLEAVSSMIDACAKKVDPAGALRWFTCGKELGLAVDLKMLTSIIDAFARDGNVAAAIHWFNHLVDAHIEPDVVVYSAVLNALAKKGDAPGALKWLHKMENSPHIKCDLVTFNTAMDAFATSGDVTGAENVLARMEAHTVAPSDITFVTLLKASARSGNTESAERHFEEHIRQRRGVTVNVQHCNVMMDCYARVGDVAKTKQWLDRFDEFKVKRNVVSFTTFFKACRRKSDLLSAAWGFAQMEEAQIKPDTVVFNTLLSVAAEENNTCTCPRERRKALAFFLSEMKRHAACNQVTEQILTRALGPASAKQWIMHG
eukprot:GEMP01003845.1.p1 GENE.GEMP01003845.1~~GEMP01003845.1.p1  ORF type:complete len:813 (-),score=249.31 GEMP01003845.1:1895-4333(-)